MLKTYLRIVPVFVLALIWIRPANAVYVGNDPLNNVDPLGLEKQTHQRDGFEITIEAGDLTYDETSAILDREVNNSFFQEHSGDLSGLGKSVSGVQADEIGVVSQLVGGAITQFGTAEMQTAWDRVANIEGVAEGRLGGNAGWAANDPSSPLNYGTVQLDAATISNYSPGTYGAQTAQTIGAWMIHETRHFTDQNMADLNRPGNPGGNSVRVMQR